VFEYMPLLNPPCIDLLDSKLEAHRENFTMRNYQRETNERFVKRDHQKASPNDDHSDISDNAVIGIGCPPRYPGIKGDNGGFDQP
jgi:hypothetical protein